MRLSWRTSEEHGKGNQNIRVSSVHAISILGLQLLSQNSTEELLEYKVSWIRLCSTQILLLLGICHSV